MPGTGWHAWFDHRRTYLLTGRFCIVKAEHWEPYEPRGSRTVLGAPGGGIPPREPLSAVSPERNLCPEGLELDRSTLGDWVGQAAWLLDPVVAKIRQHVFAADKIHGDDTTVPVLAPGLGRTATGRLWVYVRDDRLFCGPAAPAAAYFYSPDRGGKHPAAHMASFTGFLQADGYAGFEGLYNPARTKPGPITEVACLAHCRRKFYDVWEATKSPIAKEALDRIATIYAIENKARFAPAAERVKHRRETAPLLDKFFDWSKATAVKLSGKLELAKAFLRQR